DTNSRPDTNSSPPPAGDGRDGLDRFGPGLQARPETRPDPRTSRGSDFARDDLELVRAHLDIGRRRLLPDHDAIDLGPTGSEGPSELDHAAGQPGGMADPDAVPDLQEGLRF